MSDNEKTILELVDVHAGYGGMEILKGISLKVRAGEIVTLIGANGAGKTTTLNTICGMLRTGRGSIRLFGQDLTHAPTTERVRRGLSQVPEGRKLFSDLTVRENLEMGAYLRRDRIGIRQDLDHVYSIFPVLKSRQKQMAGSLSGGEQQMCAIARAMMARPALLLLDEPSLGLAPLLIRQIFKIIRQLNQQDGTTILLVEQNAHMALKTAGRGYVMETGQITITDDAESLLQNEKVKAAYLGD